MGGCRHPYGVSLFSGPCRPRASLPLGGPLGFRCRRPGQPRPCAWAAQRHVRRHAASLSDDRFPADGRIELVFSATPERMQGRRARRWPGRVWVPSPPPLPTSGRSVIVALLGYQAAGRLGHTWGPHSQGGREGVYPSLSKQSGVFQARRPWSADVSVQSGPPRRHHGGLSFTAGAGSRLSPRPQREPLNSGFTRCAKQSPTSVLSDGDLGVNINSRLLGSKSPGCPQSERRWSMGLRPGPSGRPAWPEDEGRRAPSLSARLFLSFISSSGACSLA